MNKLIICIKNHVWFQTIQGCVSWMKF
jgi:hypothetical protein